MVVAGIGADLIILNSKSRIRAHSPHSLTSCFSPGKAQPIAPRHHDTVPGLGLVFSICSSLDHCRSPGRCGIAPALERLLRRKPKKQHDERPSLPRSNVYHPVMTCSLARKIPLLSAYLVSDIVTSTSMAPSSRLPASTRPSSRSQTTSLHMPCHALATSR